MFMQYCGGGVGHKYMREIDEKYENMSREHLHGKQRRLANNMDTNGANDSNDKPNKPAQPGPSHTSSADRPGSEGPGDDADGNGAESDDGDSMPPEMHTSDSNKDEFVDSDKMGLDLSYESYRLWDL